MRVTLEHDDLRAHPADDLERGQLAASGDFTPGTLIPMGFASILGGMATTIGTSTNLLVVNVAADMGMDAFNMFDFLGPAAIAGVFATLYLWLIAPRITPEVGTGDVFQKRQANRWLAGIVLALNFKKIAPALASKATIAAAEAGLSWPLPACSAGIACR